MLPLGVLSIIQAVFLPGIAASLFIGNLRWIDRVLLAIPLSLVINYVLVLCLTLVGLYNRPLMFLAVAIEIIILIAIFAKNTRIFRGVSPAKHWKPADRFRMQPKEFPLYFLLAAFIVFFNNEAWYQIGTVFQHWDAVVSWNRWAVTWFHGELPHGTWQYPDASQTYPQGIPILYSLTYQFIDDERVQYFAKAIAVLLPYAAIATLMRMAFLIESARNILLLSIPIFILLLANGWMDEISFIFSGYVDAPIAYFGVLVCYLFMLLSQRIPRDGTEMPDDNFIYVAIVIASATALIKQTGVLVAFLFPLAWFYYFGRHEGRQARKKLFWSYLIVVILAGHWYVYKAIQIYNGTESSLLPSYDALIPVAWYMRPLSAAGLFFETYGWAWLLPLAVSLRYSVIRAMALWGVLPVFLFWAFLVSYDLRGFYLAMPWMAIMLSAGCYGLYELARTKPLLITIMGAWLIVLGAELWGKLACLTFSTEAPPAGVLIFHALLPLLVWAGVGAHKFAVRAGGEKKVALLLVVTLCLVVTIGGIRLSSPGVTQGLIDKSIADLQEIRFPGLNKFLLRMFSEDRNSGYMATSYQFAAFIPGLKERTKVVGCGDFSFLSMPQQAKYYLHVPWCGLEARIEFEKKLEPENFRLILEVDEHALYEIHM